MAAIVRLIALPVVLVLVVAFAACGGDDDESGNEVSPAQTSTEGGTDDDAGNGDGATLNACELLTADHVEAAIGERPEPAHQTIGDFDSCGYYGMEQEFVQLQVCDCLTGEDFIPSLEAGAESQEQQLEIIDGVGEQAAWLDGILWTTQGEVTINLWISTEEFDEAEDNEMAIAVTSALAQQILDRLEQD